MAVDFPPWEALTPEQKARINNGVGPVWLPASWRNAITVWSAWFFQEASWAHHDYGYRRGYRERHRIRCDWLFFKAMLRDCACLHPLKIGPGIILAHVYFGSVLSLGWLSFNRISHATLPDWLVDFDV